MKKLLKTLAVAAVTATTAMATDYDDISFESTEGALLGDLLSPRGSESARWRWNDNGRLTTGSIATEWSAVREYGESNKPTEDAGSQYLHVDNIDPLYRYVSLDERAVSIGDGGLFVDMWVRFTTSDVAPTNNPGDKISLWMAEDSTGARQLVVMAGEVNVSSTATSPKQYAVSVEGFTPDTTGWHRLVVKSYSKVGDSGTGADIPAFVVFIDGQPATITGAFSFDDETGNIVVDSEDTSVSQDSGFTVNNTALAAKYAAKQLFPTMDKTSTSLLTVGFAGQGDVDLHKVTDVDPISENVDVASLSFDISIPAGATVSPATISGLAPGDTATFTLTIADGYKLGSVTFDGADITDEVNTDGTATAITMPNPLVTSTYSLTITVVPYIAQLGENYYDDLAEAFEDACAQEGTVLPLVLCSDVQLVTTGDPIANVDTGTEVTLDLNGHKVLFASEEEAVDVEAITVQGSLTIVDSASGGSMSADEGLYILRNNGEVNIEAGTFDGEFVAEGTCTYAISGGRFNMGAFTDGDPFDGGTFLLADSVAGGVTVSQSGDYWVVGGGSSDDFPVNWNGNDGANAPAAVKAKYASWKESNPTAGTGESDEKAFLLNVAPSATLTLETTAIKVVNGVVTITTNQDLDNVNGVVYVLWGSTPDTVVTPVAVGGEDIDMDDVSVDAEDAQAKFFKVGVGYVVPAAPDPEGE